MMLSRVLLLAAALCGGVCLASLVLGELSLLASSGLGCGVCWLAGDFLRWDGP